MKTTVMNDGSSYRNRIFKNVQRVVIKLGTGVLTNDAGALDTEKICSVAEQVSQLWQQGVQVVLVSSGAVTAGLHGLGLTKRPKERSLIQAAAAIGQGILIEQYRKFFNQHNRSIAQILLTHSDVKERERHLNSKNTLEALLQKGVVPVINENDTVAVEEICFGDNDYLSALVTHLVHADLLILLSSVDGLINFKKEHIGEVIDLVPSINSEVMRLVQSHTSTWGQGGMQSKLEAARMVTGAGSPVILANGNHKDVILDLFHGKNLGTLFLAESKRINDRKTWIAFFHRPQGAVIVDDGACVALLEKGKSLLSSGILQVKSDFEKGDVVAIINSQGQEIARGLTNYSSKEVLLIHGKRSNEISLILGVKKVSEVIHRDNLVLI